MQKSRERINEAAGAARKGLPSRRIASDYNKEYVLKLENEREPTVKTESGNLSQRTSGGSDGGLELSIDVPEGWPDKPLDSQAVHTGTVSWTGQGPLRVAASVLGQVQVAGRGRPHKLAAALHAEHSSAVHSVLSSLV